MNTVTVEFPYTETEAVKGMMEMTKELGIRFRVYPFLGLFLLLLGVVFSIRVGVTQSNGFLIIFGAVLASTPLLSRLWGKSYFKKLPIANQVVFWTFTDEGVECKSTGAQSSIAWKLLTKVKETKDGFLFFSQPRYAYWVPKHAFESESEIGSLVRIIENSGVKFKTR